MPKRINLFREPEMYNYTEENDYQRNRRLTQFVLVYGPQKCKQEFHAWAVKAKMLAGNYQDESSILEAMASLAYRVKRQTLQSIRKS